MIQNFNSELASTHKYTGEEFSHHYEVGDFNIYLRADAKNRIFLTRYDCPSEFAIYFENIAAFIQDKHLDDLLKSLYSRSFEFFQLDTMDLKTLSFINIALMHFKEALYLYRGDLRSTDTIKNSELICRCMRVDKDGFEKQLLESKGSKSEILKATNMSLICGSCTEDVKQELASLQQRHKVFEGRAFDDWKQEINKHVEEFQYYSPKEFSGAKIELKELRLPKLFFQITSEDIDLSASLAKRSLENYLGEELKQPFDIIVSLNKPA